MGWGRMLLLGDWGQQMDIHDQRADIEALKRQIRSGSSNRAKSTVAMKGRSSRECQGRAPPPTLQHWWASHQWHRIAFSNP